MSVFRAVTVGKRAYEISAGKASIIFARAVQVAYTGLDDRGFAVFKVLPDEKHRKIMFDVAVKGERRVQAPELPSYNLAIQHITLQQMLSQKKVLQEVATRVALVNGYRAQQIARRECKSAGPK